MLPLLLGAALAGYGDARDGLPSHTERFVHLWTNAVRVDPPRWKDEYGGGQPCWADFSREERAPKPPLAQSLDLVEVARLHSVEMRRADQTDGGREGSSLSHSSPDGTSMQDRVFAYYQGNAIGENVAWGYPDPFAVVMGWMCSPGHRENILRPEWIEFGAGEAAPFWTQNFGAGRAPVRSMNLGLHLPVNPRGSVELFVDTWGEAEDVRAVVDGEAFGMDPWAGEADAVVWRVEVPLARAGCHAYWFEATVDGEAVVWPEDGAYGWGPCAYDDDGAAWFASRDAWLPEPADEGEPPSTPLSEDGTAGDGVDVADATAGCGCHQGAGLAAVPWLALAALRRRRGAR
jgi:hypothetical protein